MKNQGTEELKNSFLVSYVHKGGVVLKMEELRKTEGEKQEMGKEELLKEDTGQEAGLEEEIPEDMEKLYEESFRNIAEGEVVKGKIIKGKMGGGYYERI